MVAGQRESSRRWRRGREVERFSCHTNLKGKTMDNFHVDITSEGHEQLVLAIQILWGVRLTPRTATHYRVDAAKGLIFYWMDPYAGGSRKVEPARAVIPLPFPMKADLAVPFIEAWLNQADYGREPGHDGSNGHGFRAYVEEWGRVKGEDCSFAAFKPQWAWYGK